MNKEMNNVSLQKDFMRSHIWAVFTLEVFYEHKDSFMWNQTVRPLNSLRTVSGGFIFRIPWPIAKIWVTCFNPRISCLCIFMRMQKLGISSGGKLQHSCVDGLGYSVHTHMIFLG